MSNNTLHIAIFGRRNQGKSSLMNLLTGQRTSIVSDTPGTTTDPVKKSCELFGLGRCVLVDTAGFDDTGELGGRRSERTFAAVQGIDVAVLVVSGNVFPQADVDFADLLQKQHIPFLILHNKADRQPLTEDFRKYLSGRYPESKLLDFSAVEAAAKRISAAGENSDDAVAQLVGALNELVAARDSLPPVSALQGIVKAGEKVVLVCPIDGEAPKDRLILPQVMLARQCLDLHAIPLLCQVEELPALMASLAEPPALVVTDSQVFGQVAEILPESQPLTGFSICLARQKGNFGTYLQGTRHLDRLEDGQKILMLESCTHQVNCQDIGRVKLPAAIRKKSGKQVEFQYISGADPLPDDLASFAMAIQCGGCMVSDRQLSARIEQLRAVGLPVANYGMVLAWEKGIFARATALFSR